MSYCGPSRALSYISSRAFVKFLDSRDWWRVSIGTVRRGSLPLPADGGECPSLPATRVHRSGPAQAQSGGSQSRVQRPQVHTGGGNCNGQDQLEAAECYKRGQQCGRVCGRRPAPIRLFLCPRQGDGILFRNRYPRFGVGRRRCEGRETEFRFGSEFDLSP